jgi:hypothetical protein
MDESSMSGLLDEPFPGFVIFVDDANANYR